MTRTSRESHRAHSERRRAYSERRRAYSERHRAYSEDHNDGRRSSPRESSRPSRSRTRDSYTPSSPANNRSRHRDGRRPSPRESSRPSRSRTRNSFTPSSSANNTRSRDADAPSTNWKRTDMSGDIQQRIAAYNATMGKSNTLSESTIVPLLAQRSYHLPGNTWRQDWWMYMANNHPLLGICCHHELHPIGACTRIVALLGTLIFGLVMINAFYLFYLMNPRFDQAFISIKMNDGDEWVLTTGMMLFWTVGGSLHTTYNLFMWHIAACACCRTGGCCESVAWCPSFGKHLMKFFVIIIVGLAIMIVLLRVAITNTDGDTDSFYDEETDSNFNFRPEEDWEFQVNDAREFQFLMGYLVEMVLSLFIYYPVVGTILFSGILGCGTLPLLGGRPQEVAAEERQKKQQEIRELQINAVRDTSSSASDEEDVEFAFTPQAVRQFGSK